MKIALLLFCSLFGQETAINNSTSVGPAARYQIVQSSLVIRDTFRVDTFQGNVWILTENTKGEFSWLLIRRLPHPLSRITHADKVNFQMFISGLAAKNTFL